MKKLLFAAAAAVLAFGAMAKTADELRVYINPGHGSYTANDRPMAIRGHGAYSRYDTDTTSFFESNTNLRKGFGVLEKLRQMGLKFDPTLNQEGERWQIGAARDMSNNIVMSHVKCGPFHDDNGTANQLKADGKPVPEDLEYYNRSLTEIDMEVDANNFDMFISIHSNALNSDGKWYTTNFPIVLYRGYDDVTKTDEGIDNTHSATSKEMAQKVWPYHMSNVHEGWTAYSTTNANIRGDLNFYGSGSIARGYKGYLGVLKHGVPGFLIEGYFHQYAPAALRHMNWDADYVEGYNYAHGIADFFGLTKENVGTIYGIVRDQHERFRDETYVPLPTHNDAFKPLDNVTVTLLKDGQSVATYTTDNQFNGVFVFNNVEPGTYTMSFAAEGYKTPEPVEVTVEAAEVAYPCAFMESEGYEPPVVTYVDYPDLIEGTSFAARDEYVFDQAVLDREIAELAGKTVERLIHHDGKLYILALDAEKVPTILVLDAASLEVIGTPGVEGMEGTEKACSDITVSADGILVASAKELCHYNDDQVEEGETRGECNIYRWANNKDGVPEGNPELWFNTRLSANMYRAWTGESLTYQGTMEEGRILVSSENAYVGGTPRVWFNVIEIAEGEKLAESHRNKVFDNYFDYNTIGHYRVHVSPLNSENFMIDGSGVEVAEAEMDDIANEYTIMPEGIISTLAENEGFFRHGGKSYLVAPDQSEEGNGGVVLVDVTAGLENATVVPTTNTAVEASAEAAHAAGTGVITKDGYGDVASSNIALFLLRGNKISRFTTEGVKQPQPHREYAYAITVENDGTAYTVNFKSTGNAPGSAVVLTETETGRQEVFEGGAVVKGDNAIQFDATDLIENNYNVAVRIVNNNIPEAGCYYEDNNGVTKRGGVVTIKDTESDNLGYVAVTTGGACGVKIYAPDGTVTGPFFVNDTRLQASNQSSMFRGDEREGLAVFSDWSDGGAGYWVVDPSNPVDMTQLLAGTKDGKGSYTYEGTIIGGGSSCVAFQGKGENTRMLSFLEDYPTGNTSGSQNRVYAYNIGTAEQITTIPDQAYDNLTGGAFLANQNVEIVAVNDDVFAVAQCRGEGNNVSGCPGFAFISNDGDILFQSSDLEYLTSVNSGVAISADGKLFAAGQYGSKITVLNLTWDEDGYPEFTKLVDIPTGAVSWSQMRFDIGGNLHVYERETGGYHAYAIPGVAPETLVPAKAQYIVKGNGESGVEDVTVAPAAGEAIYYNLNGVRVDSENLSTGVYIKVVGNNATKVIIR